MPTALALSPSSGCATAWPSAAPPPPPTCSATPMSARRCRCRRATPTATARPRVADQCRDGGRWPTSTMPRPVRRHRRHAHRGPDADGADTSALADADGLGAYHLPVAAQRRGHRRRHRHHLHARRCRRRRTQSAWWRRYTDGHGTPEIADQCRDRGRWPTSTTRPTGARDHHRHGDRRPDADGVEHAASPTPTASAPQLPVAARRRRHRRRDRHHLHAGRCRCRRADRRAGVVHRRPGTAEA